MLGLVKKLLTGATFFSFYSVANASGNLCTEISSSPRQAAQSYGLEEAISQARTILTQERMEYDNPRGSGVWRLLEDSNRIVNWDLTALNLSNLDFSRINTSSPTSQTTIQLGSGLSARDSFLAGWGQDKVELPLSQIRAVAEIPVVGFLEFASSRQDALFESRYFLAELTNEQVVFVSRPLRKNREGQPIYDEVLFSQARMAEAGALQFLHIGRDVRGDYRSVIPVFNPSMYLLRQGLLELREVRSLFEQIDLMENLDVPFWNQKISARMISEVRDHLDDILISGGGSRPLQIFGIERSARRPWELEFENKDQPFPIGAEEATSHHPFHMSNIVKALLFNQLPYENKVSFVNDRISQGRVREVFTLIYLDMLYPNHLVRNSDTGSERDSTLPRFWLETAFEARVDDMSSIQPDGWVNGRSLRQHFKKHGEREFGLESREEYLNMATEFFTSTDLPTILIRQQGSGQYFKYNFETNELGVLNSNLQIITYYQFNPRFRPESEYEGSLADQLLD